MHHWLPKFAQSPKTFLTMPSALQAPPRQVDITSFLEEEVIHPSMGCGVQTRVDTLTYQLDRLALQKLKHTFPSNDPTIP